MDGDGPDSLSRFIEQQCLWPPVLLDQGLRRTEEQHPLRSEQVGEKGGLPLLCPHILTSPVLKLEKIGLRRISSMLVNKL